MLLRPRGHPRPLPQTQDGQYFGLQRRPTRPAIRSRVFIGRLRTRNPLARQGAVLRVLRWGSPSPVTRVSWWGAHAPPIFSALRRRVPAPSGSSPRLRRRFSSRALLRSLACGVCVCVSALQRALCLLQRYRQNKTKTPRPDKEGGTRQKRNKTAAYSDFCR